MSESNDCKYCLNVWDLEHSTMKTFGQYLHSLNPDMPSLVYNEEKICTHTHTHTHAHTHIYIVRLL